MPPVLIVPGLGGSGEHHWQTHLERTYPGAVRVQQERWYNPDYADWMETLRAAIERQPGAVLAAHSLGCVLIAHLTRARPHLPVAAALLVAPADVDAKSHLAEELSSFSPMPLSRLPFPSVVVASTNDPFMEIARAREVAEAWGADFVNIGRRGHINVDSGFGHWPLAEEILDGLTGAQLARRRRAS